MSFHAPESISKHIFNSSPTKLAEYPELAILAHNQSPHRLAGCQINKSSELINFAKLSNVYFGRSSMSLLNQMLYRFSGKVKGFAVYIVPIVSG